MRLKGRQVGPENDIGVGLMGLEGLHRHPDQPRHGRYPVAAQGKGQINQFGHDRSRVPPQIFVIGESQMNRDRSPNREPVPFIEFLLIARANAEGRP